MIAADSSCFVLTPTPTLYISMRNCRNKIHHRCYNANECLYTNLGFRPTVYWPTPKVSAGDMADEIQFPPTT